MLFHKILLTLTLNVFLRAAFRVKYKATYNHTVYNNTIVIINKNKPIKKNKIVL